MIAQEDTPWQDPCLGQPFSISRFTVLTLLFLAMIGGSILLFVVEDRPFGIQFSSIVIYSAAVALYTFSRNRNGNQPFRLSCPVVREEFPRLVRRHLGFLVALFMLQTTSLELRSILPVNLITPPKTDASPFALILGALCGCLALVQVIGNRSLLERAHLAAKSETAWQVTNEFKP